MSKQEIDQSKQPKIKIVNIFFPEVFVDRGPEINVLLDIDLDISNDYAYNEEQSLLQVNQRIVICETGGEEEIRNVLGVAFFKIEKENEIEDKRLTVEQFATHNAPAIIYPYMREYISYISLKAGIDSIVLPITNFHAIADMKEENKE